ncbi:MAG: hypothetical protein K9J30_14845 [Bacteroidales bacterium]|nr:hypothetical protein [Bacteroidales bacterium]
MRKVVEKLKVLYGHIDLEKRFDYIFDIPDTLFTQQEIQELKSCGNAFDRNVKLKWILNKKYETIADSTEIDFWIIQNWGGIKGFKQNDSNLKKIKAFRKQLNKKNLTIKSFSTISSLSKLSSFQYPKDYH